MYPKKGYQLIIETDASDKGIGACLKQINPNLAHYKTKDARIKGTKDEDDYTKSEEEIIELASHTLKPNEQSWGSTQKELYAIYFYLNYWKHYIGSKNVIVRTDNTGVSDSSGKMPRNQTMERWFIKLQDFNWTVERIKGKDNTIADWLSRQMEIDKDGKQIVKLNIGIKNKDIKTPNLPTAQDTRNNLDPKTLNK